MARFTDSVVGLTFDEIEKLILSQKDPGLFVLTSESKRWTASKKSKSVKGYGESDIKRANQIFNSIRNAPGKIGRLKAKGNTSIFRSMTCAQRTKETKIRLNQVRRKHVEK